jgi:transcriptional regulator with XRE-family HTH domain
MSYNPTRRLPPSGGRTGIERLELQEFGRKLQGLLNAKGMSKSDLARLIWGETQDSRGRTVARNRDRISQYVAGRGFPEPQNLARMAEALDVPVEELAPDIVASTVDREDPAIQMTAVAGHMDKVYLRVNTLVSMTVAAQVIGLLSGDPVVLDASR